MKKVTRNILIALVALIFAGAYYYVSLPALNVHSSGCWFFVMSLIIILMFVYAIRKRKGCFATDSCASKR